MKSLIFISAVLAFLGIATLAVADEKADPTGTWTWMFPNQNAVHELQLKLVGGKLTGVIKSYKNDRESPIEDAAYKDGSVSFKHTYKNRTGQISTAIYTGTVSGDTIQGKIEFKHPERTISRVWYATRTK